MCFTLHCVTQKSFTAVEVPTCTVELKCRQDLSGVQLRSESRDVKTSTLHPCTHTLQEYWLCSADQIYQSVLQEKKKSEVIKSPDNERFSGCNDSTVLLTACNFTAIHWECLRMEAIPLLKVFLIVLFLSRACWQLPSSPPRPRHRGVREILGVNMAFTSPLRKAEKGACHCM